MPTNTACDIVRQSSFCKIFRLCQCTVETLISNNVAISFEDFPQADQNKQSRSRFDKQELLSRTNSFH